MITLEIFLTGLIAISIFTSLTTEAVKKFLTEHNIKYYSNTIAGLVAVVLSIAVGIGYVVFTGMLFTSQNIIYLIALVFLSWLCAMIGYDKVIQTIKQFKTPGKD